MRALTLSLFVLALTFTTAAFTEINNLYYAEYGRKLIPHETTAYANYSNTLDKESDVLVSEYGLDKVPSQSGSNFLDTGWTILSSGVAVIKLILMPLIGFGSYIKEAWFQSMPGTIETGINWFVRINALITIASFLRGFNPS